MNSFLIWSRYNQSMNERLFSACGRLSAEQFREDRGAFFGSVCRTLNHILIADHYWLCRFSPHDAAPVLLDEQGEAVKIRALDQLIYEDLPTLKRWRAELDDRIVACMARLQREQADLSQSMTHRLADGSHTEFTRQKALCHWFNHQTHHRGQVTTLLTQMGVEVGTTDLLLMDLG
ncbi:MULTISPECIES: DinB family protein [unclassified Ketobacter]|uniref:DinB family protein n=1 Tax=unclassified Ketobacter TaxID=2639109 RepID=UPI000F23896E|nr:MULTISPECIES: DinB family protein [unclassified Ketobacter]RLT90861.1 MAG: damage-inducible protein DinB [Ketobacter sp. GenoA1]RLT94664.1 MAG: damage-inducible protein DinB [Ketobacter sp.]